MGRLAKDHRLKATASVIRAALFGFAALAGVAAAPAPKHVVTVPVSTRISIGDPDIYLAIAVLDPRIAEIDSGYLIIASRPLRGHIDGLSMGPEWSAASTGTTSAYDLSAARLAQVEHGIRELGFRGSAIHGWLVSAPGIVFMQQKVGPVKIGEIFVDLGPASRAAAAIEPLTKDSSAAIQRLEATAAVHIAFAYRAYYRPDCGLLERRIKTALTERARDSTMLLVDAIGRRLHLIDVVPFSSHAAVCPDVHPVTITSSNDWKAPSFAGFGDRLVGGTARFAIGAVVPRHAAPSIPPAAIEEREPYFGQGAYPQLASERYVVTTSSLRAKLTPDAALLRFSYAEIPRSRIESMLAELGSLGIRPSDAFIDSDVGVMHVWVRVAPATNERARQIRSVMSARAEEEPLLALFTNDCSGRAAAIAEALERSRKRAERIAQLLHARLGQPLSITVREEELDDSACGFSPNATTAQLAHAAVLSPAYFDDPMFARFPVRIDVAWSLSGKPATSIPVDRTYTKRWPGPSCSAAEDAALQQDIEAANLDDGSIWSLLEAPPQIEPNRDAPGCLNVDVTIRVIHHP